MFILSHIRVSVGACVYSVFSIVETTLLCVTVYSAPGVIFSYL